MLIEMQTWFFVLVTVGNKPSNQMDNEIRLAAMTRVLDLGNVFELVNDALNEGSFAHQQFVRQVHELVLHVFAQSGDEVKSLFKEQLREGSGNIAAIPEQFAAQPFHHSRDRSAIIDVAWGQATRQQVASVIDGQMQLEAKEPAHARLATPGFRSKDAVLADPFGVAHCQRRRVDEADACASPISALQIGQQGNHHLWDQGHKARVTEQTRKFAAEMHLDIVGVIRFEGSIVRLVKMNENGHHLTGP